MLNSIRPPYLGAAYYPEVWPLENIDGDIRQMKEAGCNVMRIAEFAWGAMEPEEGKYEFGWLHTVVDKLYEAGIGTILCTPTATPPQWLTDRYEDTRQMSDSGVRTQHGARRHTCPNSPTMREFNRRIVTRMAEEFKGHPGVIGWQIDNEIYPYNDGCFCPICRSGFQKWLEKQFGTIERLNSHWGMARWSLSYRSFESILPPRRDTWNHPSLQAAWLRYMSQSYVEFAHEQADILHAYFKVPIGTDMMPFLGYNYYDVHKKLDLVQFNHYNNKETLHDQVPFCYDFLRPIKDVPFWNTETQTGWNGSVQATGGWRPEGFCYANTWLPLAAGGEANLYWLWKCHPHGHELMHGSVVTSAGKFTHTLGEVQQASREFALTADFLNGTRVPRAEVALHMSNTAFVSFKYVPFVEGFDYMTRLQGAIHKPMTQNRHIHVDILDTPASLEGYRVVVSPFLSCLDEYGLKERLKTWIENGGTWIAGPLTDIMDDQLVRYTRSTFSVLEEWAGVECKYQIPFQDCGFKAQWEDGSDFTGGLC